MTAHWSKIIDPYWSIGDLKKTKAFFYTIAAVNKYIPHVTCMPFKRKIANNVCYRSVELHQVYTN